MDHHDCHSHTSNSHHTTDDELTIVVPPIISPVLKGNIDISNIPPTNYTIIPNSKGRTARRLTGSRKSPFRVCKFENNGVSGDVYKCTSLPSPIAVSPITVSPTDFHVGENGTRALTYGQNVNCRSFAAPRRFVDKYSASDVTGGVDGICDRCNTRCDRCTSHDRNFRTFVAWKPESQSKKRVQRKNMDNVTYTPPSDISVLSGPIADIADRKACELYLYYRSTVIKSDEEIRAALELAQIINLDGNITVLQDHALCYTTKIRGFKFFEELKNEGYKGVVHATMGYSMGQIAVSWCCKQVGMECHLFGTGRVINGYISNSAIAFGATIKLDNQRRHTGLRSAEENAKRHAETMGEEYYFLETGSQDRRYRNAIVENMKIVKAKYNLNPTEIWVAGCTGILASCIYEAFKVKIHIVIISGQLWKDILEDVEYETHQYPIALGNAKSPFQSEIPYRSLPNLDAKVYFFRDRMAPGAMIWNCH